MDLLGRIDLPLKKVTDKSGCNILVDATGHFADRQILASIETGYGLRFGTSTMTTFAGVDLGTVDPDVLAETGGGMLARSRVRSARGSRPICRRDRPSSRRT